MSIRHLTLLAAAWTLLASLPCAFQDEEPIVDERPEIQGLFDELAGHTKARGEEDEEAIAVLDRLVTEFPKSGPKDRVAIVKNVSDCFKVKRTKELQEGVPDDRLYVASAVALGTMGPESVKPLSDLLGHKSFRKNERLQIQIAQAIGKTKSLDGVKPLLGLLKHKDAPMQAAGAEALGYYFDAPLDTRKDIFDEILKIMMGQKSKKDADINDFEAQDRWNVISGPCIATLQKLSGHGETDPEMWQRWWNDNKKKDWTPKED